MVYPYSLLMSAHNALQNALYGSQHAQLATTNHQMAPPPANAPQFDGLVYRSSLLSFVLPAAPPPASEWSVQSKVCLDHLGAIARDIDPTIEDPTEQFTLHCMRLSRGQGLNYSSAPATATLSSFIDSLTISFAQIAHQGTILGTTIRRYQYERDAYTQQDSDTPIPSQLVASYQVITHSISEIRNQLSQPKHNDSLKAIIDTEARQTIKDAIHYVEFYLEPYKGPIVALARTYWDVDQAVGARADKVKIVTGHMRWLMEQEDGDVRNRIKRTKLHM